MELPVLLAYTWINHIFSHRIGILALTVLLLILLQIEYIRLEYKPKIPEMFNVFRHKEKNNVTGTIFFIMATIVVFAAFDYAIALTALLLTVFGDLFSALVGIKFGRHFLKKGKTFEGFFAGLVVNIGIAFLLFPSFPPLYLSMALVASLVELLTGKLDDNLTVPLFAAFTGQIMSYFLQIPLGSFPGPIVESMLQMFR